MSERNIQSSQGNSPSHAFPVIGSASQSQYGLNFAHRMEEPLTSNRFHYPPPLDITEHDSDLGNLRASVRNMIQKPNHGDRKSGHLSSDFTALEPLSARKKGLAMSMTSTDRFLPSKKPKPPGSRGQTPEVNTQEQQLRSLRTVNAAMSDYAINDFYLSSKADTRNLNLRTGKSATALGFHWPDDNPRLGSAVSPKTALGLGMGKRDSVISTKGKFGNFYDSMPPSLREFYAEKKEFMKIFEDYNVANFCLDEVAATTLRHLSNSVCCL